ncbi:MAG: DUF2809 domain-containing protein [Cyanobacteria bacterium P01_A01_bin.84]
MLSIFIVIPLGYIIRFSQGPLPGWLNDFLGSVAYEIFWVLLFALILSLISPQVSPLKISMGVFIATCGIEFLQLWKPPFLEAARSTLPGRLVLGNSFVWWDFISYFAGSVTGWLWLKALRTYFYRNYSDRYN